MASNNLAGFLAVYANEGLPQLIAQAPVFNAFTTDFSGDLASGGTSMVTRVPTTTYTANDTAANGYVALAASSSAVTVTLKQRDVTHAFSELEWQNSSQLIATFVPSMIKSLVNHVANDVMSGITSANFSTAQVSSVAGFSGSAITKLSQVLSTANCPDEDRSLIILPTLKETMTNTINQAYFMNPDASYVNYAGFKVSQYSNIPTNSQNLHGIAAHKSAIAIASRIPSFGGNVEQTVVTDPTSGFSVAFRTWHSADDGAFKLAASVIYGYAKGNGSALVRITSA